MLSDNFSPNNLRPIFSHALSLKLETIKLDAFIQNYSAGQTLSGRVVQVLPEQKAVVELQGEKLLLQFPRPVNPGQSIAIKIEQIHPNLVLKLTDFASLNSSQKSAPGNLAKEAPTLNTHGTDKTSIQSRHADSLLESTVTGKNEAPGVKNGPVNPDVKIADPISKQDLKQLGIQVGQKVKAEVLRVVNREILQVRFNGNEVTLKHAASQKLLPGEPVFVHAKPISSGNFALVVEPISTPSSTVRLTSELSILRDYLSARQPLVQVFTGLKKVFLDESLTLLKDLNIDLGPLKQLQANLQKIVSREAKVPDAVHLKEIVNRSGFHYEAKVRNFVVEPDLSGKNALLENDLKGQLMRFVRQLEQVPIGITENTASDKLITKLMSQMNQAISNIELQQLVHYFSKEEQHPLLLQLPENLLGDEDRFKIYILPDQREEKGTEPDFQNKAFNLVFLLNLSALGDLRIETKVFKDEVSIHILGSNSGAVRFIQAHAPDLENIFQQEGFSINVTSSHQTEVSLEVTDSLGQLLIDTPLQMVDVKT